MTYAILQHPGHNRVYFETALRLSLCEFRIAAQKFSVAYENLRNENICGIDYLAFDTSAALTGGDIGILSGLSFVFALFEIDGIGKNLRFIPLKRLNENFVSDSISSILKYTGKTNEIFTRMMLNIAAASIDCNAQGGINLLDPIAGKGTTIYEALIKGYNSYGIEIGDKVTTEAYLYLKRFLENAKYKFSLDTVKISGAGKAFTATRHSFTMAQNKQAFKDGDTRYAEFIAGNSRHAKSFYKKNFFHMIVGDLPYGVQHGNVTNEKQSSLTRNPTELLNACLPSWLEVLRPGGCIVLAWNSNVLPHEKMALLFEKNGLVLKNGEAYADFEHRVDQAITRDIIVANKR